MFKTAATTLTLMSLLLGSAAAVAAPEDMEKLRLRDQHEVPVRMSANIRYVLFTHDMSGKDIVEEMLTEKPDDYLDTHDALFIADISGMPRIIARMFALPSLRKKPYRILLDEVGNQTGDWAREDDSVTLYTIDNYQVTGFSFISNAAGLEQAINTPLLAPEADSGNAEESEQNAD